eukprot:gene9083-1178_t
MEIICTICKKQYTKYTCPKCNIKYCSLHCYKSHSNECTETFYVERVLENVNLKDTPESFKTESMEMLKKIDLEKFSKVEMSDDLLDKLEKLNLENDVNFKDLPEDIKNDFMNSLKDGRISTWITTWEPFWIKKNFVIEDFKLPAIDSLTKANLSENLMYNLIDLIYSFAYTMRIFNGEIVTDSCVDMSNMILKISKLLSENFNHLSEESAISLLLENSFNKEIFESKQFSILIIKDVSMIFESKSYIIKSLQNLEDIFRMSSKMIKEKDWKMKLKLCEKKIYFYKIWVNSKIKFPSSEIDNIHQQYEE